MISAQVVVALGESPWYGEACDHCAGVGFFLVRSEDSIADAVEVKARLVHFPKIHALRLELLPTINKCLLHSIEVLQQSIPCLLPRLAWRSSKGKSCDALTITRHQVEFRGQSNVSIRRGGVFPCHLLVIADVLPAVANAYISAAHIPECCRTSQSERDSFSLREEHRNALVVADPSVVSVSTVSNVWGEQGKDAVIFQFALTSIEVDLLEEHVSLWIGDDSLSHPVTSSLAGVDEPVSGYALF